MTPEHLGGGQAGRPTADNNDSLRRSARRRCGHLGLLFRAFLPHEDLSPLLFDRPARNRAQSGRAQSFARAQIEARMVPGAAHRLAGHDAVGERTMIMRAMGRNREYLRTAPHQKHFLAADMANQLGAIAKCIAGNAQRQIRTGRFGLIFGHFFFPS
jgi:hypothetical protein